MLLIRNWYPSLDLRNSTSLNVEEEWKMSNMKLKLVSLLFSFWYIFLKCVVSFEIFIANYRGFINFLTLPMMDMAYVKGGNWNCYLSVVAVFSSFTLFYWTTNFPDPCSSPHTNFCTILFYIFIFIFLYIFTFLVFYNYFHNFLFIL